MANKFQQSIQERQQAEEKRRQQQVTPPREEVIAPEFPEPEADISAWLRHEPQRMAKNKTFYLDEEVIEAVKRTAKSQGVTDSRLVNDILRRILHLPA